MATRTGVINKTYSYRMNVEAGTKSYKIQYVDANNKVIEFFTEFSKASYQIFIDCAQYRTFKIDGNITVASNEDCYIKECINVSGIELLRLTNC